MSGKVVQRRQNIIRSMIHISPLLPTPLLISDVNSWPGSLATLMRKVGDGREVFLEAIPLHDILEEDLLDKQPGEQSLFWCSTSPMCWHMPTHRVPCCATTMWSDGCSHSGFFSYFFPTLHMLEVSLFHFHQGLGSCCSPGAPFIPCLQQPGRGTQPLLAGHPAAAFKRNKTHRHKTKLSKTVVLQKCSAMLRKRVEDQVSMIKQEI